MKSILVPIDCSAATARVLELARELAAATHAEMHLVHVREVTTVAPVAPLGYGALGMPEMVPMGGMSVPMPEMPFPDEQKTRLTQWQQELTSAGLKVTVHEPSGNVLEEILKRADAVKADLIVMGRHGHGAMYNLLAGSVTQGVLKRSARPVLLVPSDRAAEV